MTEEKEAMMSTAVANAGGGRGSKSGKWSAIVVQQNKIVRFSRTHPVPIASAYLSPYMRESNSLDK
jgi:hypothetical protein